MRVINNMDFNIVGVDFSDNANWIMKFSCQWCEKPLINQTEKLFREKGNMCPACSAIMTHKVWQRNYEAEITKRNRDIEQYRKDMDLLAEGLDLEITEEERKSIQDNMEKIYLKIKLLKQG